MFGAFSFQLPSVVGGKHPGLPVNLLPLKYSTRLSLSEVRWTLYPHFGDEDLSWVQVQMLPILNIALPLGLSLWGEVCVSGRGFCFFFD